MKLLVFAHYGEAEEFMDNIPGLAAKNQVVHGFYASSDWSLLISGEGMDKVFLSLGKVLAQAQTIERVYNFGIGAALSTQFKKGQVVPIRTSYRSLPDSMEFKSYSCASLEAKVDCVSSFERVLREEQGKKLAPFADLVDRELWAIGATCSFYHIPFESFKVISDYPGQQISCEDIKRLAPQYSCFLYQSFQQLLRRELDEKKDEDFFDLPPSFFNYYWTESLRRKFISLNRQWKVKYPKRSLLEFYKKDEKNHPKKKTIQLLNKMREELDPVNTRVRKEIESILASYQSLQLSGSSAKIKIDYDPRLTSRDMKATVNFSCREDLDQLESWIKSFPLENIQEKMEGREDVS